MERQENIHENNEQSKAEKKRQDVTPQQIKDATQKNEGTTYAFSTATQNEVVNSDDSSVPNNDV